MTRTTSFALTRRADLLALLKQISPAQLSRQLRRQRDIGVIKRVKVTCSSDLARIGRAATAALFRVTQAAIIPGPLSGLVARDQPQGTVKGTLGVVKTSLVSAGQLVHPGDLIVAAAGVVVVQRLKPYWPQASAGGERGRCPGTA